MVEQDMTELEPEVDSELEYKTGEIRMEQRNGAWNIRFDSVSMIDLFMDFKRVPHGINDPIPKVDALREGLDHDTALEIIIGVRALKVQRATEKAAQLKVKQAQEIEKAAAPKPEGNGFQRFAGRLLRRG